MVRVKDLILFSLENCPKCDATLEYFKDKKVNVIKFPHSWKDWTDDQKKQAKEYDILEDLKVVAPILVIPNNEPTRVIGQLRIKKWVKDAINLYDKS